MTETPAPSLWEVMRSRRSVRSYDSRREVEEEKLRRLLESAILAPSAGNLQSWHFLVIRDQALRHGLAQAAAQRFVGLAPAVIVVCADLERASGGYGSRGADLYCIQDTAAATQNMLLAATALGLGACWVGAFDEASVAELLRLPASLRPVALIPVGYPARVPRPPGRRPLSAVSRFIP